VNREWIFAAMAALGLHALLLCGFRLETAAIPLPAADTAIDVSLVAAPPAPAVPPAPPTPPPPEPAPPLQTPPPPAPEPAAVAEATPVSQEHLPHHAPPWSPRAKPAAPRTTMADTRAGAATAVRARSNPKPPYPAEARRLGQQGRVLLEVQVSAAGRATSVSVKRSSGFPILDDAAVQGVQRWTFEPARVGGLPTASRADVPVSFSLAQ